jgi:serine protease Do
VSIRPATPVPPVRTTARIARQATRIVACSLPLCVAVAGAQDDTFTARVFSRHAEGVVKIHVVEGGSGAKARVGSGFFVNAGGRVVTNYHVIADLIHAPERYFAEIVDHAGVAHTAVVQAIDVVHDLAVLGTTAPSPTHFDLATASADVAQGTRMYALGHPSDLGLSIVEGTYNGHLRHTLYPKIHFTGSINSGMSGGPAITEDGRVIGVNVSTAGNQLSFLVPIERAMALVAQLGDGGDRPVPTGLADLGRQLRDYQEEYLRDLFHGETRMIDLGPYRVATEPAPFFRCWGDSWRPPDLPYETIDHSCATDDRVYIAPTQQAGVVSLTHELISTRTLRPTQFYALYTSIFTRDRTPFGAEEHVTSWRCGTQNITPGDVPMRAVLCLRRYRKLGELYDAVLTVAALGRPDAGLVSTLTISGVTFENVDRLSRRYMETIGWR